MIRDLSTTIQLVSSILSNKNIQFHITGGFASSFYGEPRFTQDIDIVINISNELLVAQLIAGLSEDFIVEGDAVRDAVRCNGIFQALHKDKVIKVDFHVGEAIAGELGRSQMQEIIPGVVVPLVSKEDAILSKLIWIKKGSHKSRQDVKMMLKRKGNIDITYLDSQCKSLQVSDILQALREEVDLG